MANTKHEDAIMKMGFGYFRDSILKSLGIDYEFVADEPTELIELQIHSMYMDFTFMTTDGFYVHFEFQTTETERADLQRFEAYEAVTAHKTGKTVLTYVIYSGEITNAKTELDCGFYTYKVAPIQENTVTSEKTIAILYTLADKFLEGIDLQEIREVVLLTRLGQMIYDDGIEKGMEKGMDRMSLLTSRLLKENRLDDLQKAVEDKKYCEQLLKEYGIE